jgi:hypothetical protein
MIQPLGGAGLRLLGRGLRAGVVTAVGVLLAMDSRADAPDWQQLGGVKVVEVISEDPDGSPRETKVWFVLLDGTPYLRTNGSRWLENLRREPTCRLRIEEREFAFRAVEIGGDEIVERVDQASREKYGWQERLIHPFRLRKPEILRLTPSK